MGYPSSLQQYSMGGESMRYMQDMKVEVEDYDQEEDYIHLKNTLTIETNGTKKQQHLELKKT